MTVPTRRSPLCRIANRKIVKARHSLTKDKLNDCQKLVAIMCEVSTLGRTETSRARSVDSSSRDRMQTLVNLYAGTDGRRFSKAESEKFAKSLENVRGRYLKVFFPREKLRQQGRDMGPRYIFTETQSSMIAQFVNGAITGGKVLDLIGAIGTVSKNKRAAAGPYFTLLSTLADKLQDQACPSSATASCASSAVGSPLASAAVSDSEDSDSDDSCGPASGATSADDMEE